MTQLTVVDDELLALLRSKSRVEVVNGEGRVIGVVVFAAMSCPEFGLTDDEIEKRVNDPNAVWLTTDEVIERLQRRIGKAA